MADEENQADEPPPSPTESDVCFGDKHHPGTQHFFQVVEQIAKNFPWVGGYSPVVYCAINKELEHCRFFFHSKKQGKWVVAKKREKNLEFQKAFERMRREKDVVELEEDLPTQAATTAAPVYAINPMRVSRATATEKATHLGPACVNLFLCLLGIVSLALFVFVGPSPIFLGVFWTWVALGILFLLRLMVDEKFRSRNACCACGMIYCLTIGIMFVFFFIVFYG